jgi:hypothetical protein
VRWPSVPGPRVMVLAPTCSGEGGIVITVVSLRWFGPQMGTNTWDENQKTSFPCLLMGEFDESLQPLS